MALAIKPVSKLRLNILTNLVAILMLVASPFYGIVASQVAGAISTPISTEADLRQALNDGETEINLSGNIGVTNQISVNYSTTFNGGTITALAPGTYGSDDAVVYVSGTGVTLTANNTVIDGNNQGSGNSRRQGVKVYGGATANLNSVIIKNAKKSGLHVNGNSVANVKNITTINNGTFYGGLVVSGDGTINIGGKSTHSEPIDWDARIDGSGTINDINEQYTSGSIRRLKSAPGAPAITAPVSLVTTSSADLIWTAPSTSGDKNAAESYLVTINGGTAVSVSGLTHSLTGLTDGSYIATIQSVAKSGLLGGTATHNFTVAIPDTEKPVGSAAYSGGYVATDGVRYVKNIDDLSFTVNATDNKGVARAIYFAKNVAQPGVEACGNWNAGALTNHSFPAPLQTNVSYTVPGSSIKTCDPSMKWKTGSRYNLVHAVFDAAENMSETFNNPDQLVEIDSTKPVIQIISPLAGSTKNGIVQVEAKVTENGSGLKYVNALFTDGLTPEFGYTALILKPGTTDTYIGQIDTAGKDGKFSLGINADDNVGNAISAKAQNITLDNTAPKILTVNLNKTISKDSTNLTSNLFNSGKLDVTITTDEAVAGGTQVGFAIPGMTGPPAIGWTPFTATGGDKEYVAQVSLVERTDTSNPSFTPGFLNNKTFQNTRLYIRTRDALGNVAYTYYKVDADGNFSYAGTDYKLTVDNEKPTGVATYSGGTNVGGVRYIKSASDLKYTATLGDSGALDQTSFVVFRINPDGSRMRNSAGKALFCGNWRNSSSTINLSGTNVVLADQSIDGCAWSNGGTWGEGLYEIGHIVYDAVGHSTSFNNTEQRFVIDSTTPAVKINGTTTIKQYYKLGDSIDAHIVDDNLLETTVSATSRTSDNSWVYTGAYFGLAWLRDGDYEMKAIDKADNSTAVTFGVDHTRPVAEGSFAGGSTNGSILYNPTSFTINANDDASNNANGDKQSGLDVISYSVWEYDPSKGSGPYGTGFHQVASNSNKSSATSIFDTNILGDGKYFIIYGANDKAGNTSADAGRQYFTIDRTIPSVPTITTPSARTWHKASPILNSWTAAVDANGIDHYQIAYQYDDGHTFGGSTCDGLTMNGKWAGCRDVNGTSRNHQPGADEEGGVTIWVRAIDKAGNVGQWSSSVHYYYDHTNPSTDIHVSVSQGVMTVSGTATDNLALNRVYVQLVNRDNGQRYGGTTVHLITNPFSKEKSWSVEYNFNTNNFPDGNYAAHVEAADMAGNRGTAGWTNNYLIDTTAPESPVIVSADPAGARGTAEVGSTVEVFVDGESQGAVTADATGDWSLTFDSAFAEPGTYTVTATATDAVGNTSDPSEKVVFTIPEPEVLPPTDNGGNQGGGDNGGNTGGGGNQTPGESPNSGASRPIFPLLGSIANQNTAGDNQSTTAESDKSVLGEGDDASKSGTNLAETKADTLGWSDTKLFGLLWYWWLLLLAVIAAIWWFIAAKRRRDEDDEEDV